MRQKYSWESDTEIYGWDCKGQESGAQYTKCKCVPNSAAPHQTLKMPTTSPILQHMMGNVSEEKQKETAVLPQWLDV